MSLMCIIKLKTFCLLVSLQNMYRDRFVALFDIIYKSTSKFLKAKAYLKPYFSSSRKLFLDNRYLTECVILKVFFKSVNMEGSGNF